MNRTRKFFYNSTTTAVYQIFAMLAGFISPRIILRFYGSEINGLVSSISQFIVNFNLVEAGLTGAAIYALYKPLAVNDHKAINRIVSAAKKSYIKSGYIFVLLTLVLSGIYPMLIRTDVVTPLEIGLLVMILGVSDALDFFALSKYRALLSADQKTYIISLASLVHIIVNTIIVVILANLRVDIIVLRLAALFSIFLSSFILMTYVRAKYKYINYREEPYTAALDKRRDALYLQILGAINAGAPVVIITITSKNLMEISIYSIFNMVIIGLNGVLSIFISGLAASFGDVIARGEQDTLQKAYREFEFSYYSLISIIYSIVFVTIMPFIRIYTAGITDVNYNLPFIGVLFVLNGLLNNLKTPQGMLVISAGMYKETKWQTITQGAITVVGGIILTPFWGLAGAMAASMLSNIYRDIDLLFFIPCNVTKLPVSKTAFRWLRSSICIATIYIPFLFIEIIPKGYLSWAVFAITVGIYAIIIVALTGFIFDREDMKNSVIRILSLLPPINISKDYFPLKGLVIKQFNSRS